MTKTTQIGFSQRIQLEWLERAATMALAGQAREQIASALDEYLKAKISVGGSARASNRAKSVSILVNIWAGTQSHLQPLRAEGFELLQHLPLDAHLPLHWGMSIATYPFVATVADSVGRLLRLQGDFTATQVQRRIREQLGERETVARAARRIVRSFVDWDVLHDTGNKGVYHPAPRRVIDDKTLMAWLIEAVLIASESTYNTLRSISEAPALFPFAFGYLNLADLQAHERLETYRQGLDEDVVMLRSAVSST